MRGRGVCSIPECRGSLWSMGLCSKHYQKMRKYGDPLTVVKTTPDGHLREFYEETVLTYEGEDCLFWPFSKTTAGYAQMRQDGKRFIVSRVLCEEANGPPPTESHVAAHSCGKGHLGCVAKKHLRWATYSENERDKLLHGTDARGERCGSAKLTEEQVREIIALKGAEKQNAIAKRFGVRRQTIYKIHSGKRWAWLDEEAS